LSVTQDFPAAAPTVAIVGCGAIARVHAKNLRPRARLVFVSRNPDSAAHRARKFDGETAVSLDAVLSRGEVRGVVLASPARVHAKQAVRALEAQKTVLVEKPMATSPVEVEAIGAALEKVPSGRLMVAENYLFRPSLAAIRRFLPEVGSVRRVRLRKVTLQRSTGWRGELGALLEGGIHFAALLGAILDRTPTSVQAKFPAARLDAGDRPERHAIVRVAYPGGAAGEIRYGWDRRSLPGGLFQHSEFVGSRGRIRFGSNGLYGVIRSRRLFRCLTPGLSDLMGFQAMSREFLRLLDDPDRRPRSDYIRAARDRGIVFAAYQAGGRDPHGRPKLEA